MSGQVRGSTYLQERWSDIQEGCVYDMLKWSGWLKYKVVLKNFHWKMYAIW